MADHDHCHGLSLEQEIAVAHEALGSGDLRHAAHHVANALVDAPESLEVDDLVRRLFGAARDPMTLVELGSDVYVGAVVLRSRFLERLKRHGEAFQLLLRAQDAVPEKRLLVGLERFLDHPELFHEADVDGLAALLFTRASDEPERFLPFLQALRKPEETPLRLGMVIARCLRASGRSDEALAVSRALVEREPGFLSLVSLGSSLKDAGHSEEALDVWSRALGHDPESVPIRMDMGDLELGRGQFENARRLYAEALDREPENDWALPSWLYACWKASGDEVARDRLIELGRCGAVDSRARLLCDDAAPYRFSLPPPEASLMTVGRNAFKQRLTPTRVTVTSLEAPSAIWALLDGARETSPKSDPPRVEFGDIPKPDPRVPLARVEHVLFGYARGDLLSRIMGRLGRTACIHVAAPGQRIAERVQALIAEPYELDDWSKSAATIAVELSEQDVGELLAVMVHPPERPEGVDPWAFRFVVQVAAAFIVSQVGDGWDGSPRRGALRDLLLGPVDWTTSAGIIAACNLARIEPRLAAGVCELLEPLLSIDGGAIHYQNISQPLLRCAAWIDEPSTKLLRWVERARSLQADLDAEP